MKITYKPLSGTTEDTQFVTQVEADNGGQVAGNIAQKFGFICLREQILGLVGAFSHIPCDGSISVAMEGRTFSCKGEVRCYYQELVSAVRLAVVRIEGLLKQMTREYPQSSFSSKVIIDCEVRL